MSDKYLYRGVPAEVQSAAGVTGIIIRTADGMLMFRVYHGAGQLTDYEVRHDDLSVTLDTDAMAAFYRVGERNILDHSPAVWGLKKIEG